MVAFDDLVAKAGSVSRALEAAIREAVDQQRWDRASVLQRGRDDLHNFREQLAKARDTKG